VRRAPPSVAPLLPGDTHPANRYLETLGTAVSRETARTSANMAARLLSGGRCRTALELPWHQVRREQMLRLRGLLEQRYARVTANRMISVVRSVLREVWRAGEITAEQLQHCLDVPMVRGEDLVAGRALSRDEIRRLLASPGRRPVDVRQRALIAAYYGTACRRQELLDAMLADYTPATGALKITGKGRRQAIAWLAAADLRAFVDAWLLVRGTRAGPLFVVLEESGAVTLRPLSGRDVLMLMHRAATRAGLARFGVHDLRRSAITHLDQAGERLALIQRLARHKNIKTTLRYVRTDEAELIRAAAGLSLER
jgi:site-specific recombinase XerD